MKSVTPVHGREQALKRLKTNAQIIIDRHVNLGVTPLVSILSKQLQRNYQFENYTALKLILEGRERQFFDDGSGQVTVEKLSNGKWIVTGSTFHLREVLYRAQFRWVTSEKHWICTGHDNDFFASVAVVAKRCNIKLIAVDSSSTCSYIKPQCHWIHQSLFV